MAFSQKSGRGEKMINRYTIAIIGLSLAWVSTLCAGPPFSTDDPEPVDYHHLEFYIASAWEWTASQSNGTLPHLEFNYGALREVQVHLIVPMQYIRSGQVTQYGYSDTETGLKYRFVDETASFPQVGVFPLLEIPTGGGVSNIGPNYTRVLLPVWLQKSWGGFTTYGGGGYWYNPGDGNKNYLFTGWELQYDFSKAITLGGEAFFHTADSQDSESGSGFNLGGILNLTDNNYILFSVGHSISGDEITTAYLSFLITK
jgi:hypothetical protein